MSDHTDDAVDALIRIVEKVEGLEFPDGYKHENHTAFSNASTAVVSLGQARDKKALPVLLMATRLDPHSVLVDMAIRAIGLILAVYPDEGSKYDFQPGGFQS